MHLCKRKSLVLYWLCLLTISSCSTKPDSGEIRLHIQGRVTSTLNSSPIDSAIIQLIEEPKFGPEIISYQIFRRVLTDNNGLYSIQGVFPNISDRYHLSISANKYGFHGDGALVDWIESVQIIDFQIRPYTSLPN